jgi:hypothetical protein
MRKNTDESVLLDASPRAAAHAASTTDHERDSADHRATGFAVAVVSVGGVVAVVLPGAAVKANG